MNIAGMDKAAVLVALYNRAQPQGLGFLHFTPEPMKIEEAREIVSKYKYFDYLKGRVMKVDIGGDELRTDLYNRDNGENAAEEAITRMVARSVLSK